VSRGKVDYREVLSEKDFSLFAALREWRKSLANQEGVPVYQVFTNEQLAQVVRNKVCSKADLAAIPGVGEARVTKYSDSLLMYLAECSTYPQVTEPGTDETSP
jgi:superfamily II DNA helicase RecQ